MAWDLLITRGPPFAILDHGGGSERREGCPQLLEAVFRAFPRLHVFGHIHAGYGTLRTSDTLFVNASLLDEENKVSNQPIVIDLAPRKTAASDPPTVISFGRYNP